MDNQGNKIQGTKDGLRQTLEQWTEEVTEYNSEDLLSVEEMLQVWMYYARLNVDEKLVAYMINYVRALLETALENEDDE